MSESKGTYYLDLSDRLFLAREALEMIDEDVIQLAERFVEEGTDPHDEAFQNTMVGLQIDLYAEMVKGFTVDEKPESVLRMLMQEDLSNKEVT